MKNSDFLMALLANCNQTDRIRACTKDRKWRGSGAFAVDDKITKNIGAIVSFLDQNLRNFCADNEMLLIYNFQSANIDHYVSLQAIKKPKEEIDNTDDNSGKPIEIIINGETGEVMNPNQCWLNLGITNKENLAAEGESAIIYGNFKKYFPLVYFATFASTSDYTTINTQDIFDGKYNQSDAIQKGEVFLTFAEAYDELKNVPWKGKYIIEFAREKQKQEQEHTEDLKKKYIEWKKSNELHNRMVKLINHKSLEITVKPGYSEIQLKEAPQIQAVAEELQESAVIETGEPPPKAQKLG